MLMPNGVGTFHVKVLEVQGGGPGLHLAIEGRKREGDEGRKLQRRKE